MKKIVLGGVMGSIAIAALAAAALLRALPPGSPVPAEAGPQYTPDGRLVFPAGYREWIYVSSGFGMSYGPSGKDPAFTNVFVEPGAYRQYIATGHWPDKTMFVIEDYSSASHGSINQHGSYQETLLGVSAEVKDESRFPEKWAYFGFGTGAKTGSKFAQNNCWSCHSQNGAVDNTFVQFYPVLLKVAREKGVMKLQGAPSSAASRN